MPENKTSLRFILVILFVLGVFLLFYIGINMYSIYQGSIKDVNATKEAHSNVDCYQMAFDADFVSDNTLLVRNLVISSDNIEVLTFTDIISGNTTLKEQDFFRPGSKRHLNISSVSFEEFYVYPHDCVAISWVCNRTSRECYDPHKYNK